MSNPPKKKGTRYEGVVLEWLKPIWPKALRVSNTKGIYDKGDFENTGDWLIEAKHRKTWDIHEWIQVCHDKAGMNPWALFLRRDARTMSDVVVIPRWVWSEIMAAVKEKLQ